MGGILRGLKIIRLIMTPNQNEYVPVPLLHCRICNVLVRIRIRNPNPDPDPEHCSFRYGTYRIVPILCIATGTLPPQFYYDDVLHWDDDLW